MGDKGRMYVVEHSPYSGAARFMHYILGSIANETQEWRLYIGEQKIADWIGCDVRTVQRNKLKMVKDGYLDVIKPTGNQHGPAEYRFLMPASAHDIPSIAENLLTTSHPSAHDIPSIAPITNQEEPKSEVTSDPRRLSEPKSEVTSDPRRLSELLARGMVFHKLKEPKIIPRWLDDMGLLLRRGPSDWATPEPIPAAEVERVIRGIFTKLNQREGKGFCWADQIRSPQKLREKWVPLVLALETYTSSETKEATKVTQEVHFDPDAPNYLYA